jgi:sigma-70-like protein
MTANQSWQLMAQGVAPPGQGETEIDMWPYRDRTVALLKRYARASVEVGRLPSVLGRECFRARVTSYSMTTFEDIVIFVHDMEQALKKLDGLERKLITMNVLEEYTQAEIARRMGCTKRWIEAQVPEAIDATSRILLELGLMEGLPAERGKRCQEGKRGAFPASPSNQSRNISSKPFGIDPCNLLF